MTFRARIELPTHLRTLAGVDREVEVEWAGEPTARHMFDALDERHPVLRGTIRDHDSGARRAYVRYFVGRDDRSHDDPDGRLPESVLEGRETFRVVGAIAGG